MLTQIIAAQDSWLQLHESDIIAAMKDQIDQNFVREVSVIERLIAMIQQTIDANSPIREQWQLANDAIVVRKGRLVFPADPDPIVPTVNEFDSSMLNEEQLDVARSMLVQMQLGGVVLEQDIEGFVQRQCSSIGPLSCCGQHLTGLTFPKQWRCDLPAVMKTVFRKNYVAGTEEDTGVMSLDELHQNLDFYGEMVYHEHKKAWVGSV